VGYFCPEIFEEYTGCHLDPGEKKLMEWRLPLAENEAPVDQFCDGCIHLSPTEEEQEKLPRPRPEHWCNLFNQAVKHEGRHPRIPRLNPCLELKAKEGVGRNSAIMEFGGVRDISNADLVERAVRNATPHSLGPSPRWAAMMAVFAVGSTVAHEICEKYGLDPDENNELILED